MGYRTFDIKLPAGYSEHELKRRVQKLAGCSQFSYQIENKSLDARKKSNIVWQIRVAVHSPEIKGEEKIPSAHLDIPRVKTRKHAFVAGSGPAGFFAAFVLQQAGYTVTILERGKEVTGRGEDIARFEQTGDFSSTGNYAFGEGGAGTFSDGKLTSRSKHISLERNYIIESYIAAGAPEEIRYLAYPHVGSDNLKIVVKNLREKFVKEGGEIRFATQLNDIVTRNSRVCAVVTEKGEEEADLLIVAAGHSAFDTYRMLHRKGVQFRTKNFALGTRAEHQQNIINRAQWGVESLPGVKAAEYRLTSGGSGNNPVYSFCMCPGGIVVPATAFPENNIVNGMSLYSRAGSFANAACVAGVHPDQLAGEGVTAMEMLDWLENLERSFYHFASDYKAPFCSISSFLKGRGSSSKVSSSYPLGLVEAPLWELLPLELVPALRKGLEDFNSRLKGYSDGILLGLESKTSSPIQVLREPGGRCSGFENLYMVGEGSGYAGGIISSGADGIKAALAIIREEH